MGFFCGRREEACILLFVYELFSLKTHKTNHSSFCAEKWNEYNGHTVDRTKPQSKHPILTQASMVQLRWCKARNRLAAQWTY